ncbi:MAG: hypothetical protein IT326_10660, partial [Anaerolineae bacterium]|nr:hypothetical protein [Anaerolineae bacterium]
MFRRTSLLTVLAIAVMVCLPACQSRRTASPDIPPTPWPTLMPVVTVAPSTLTAVQDASGPQLVDKFRASVEPGLVDVFPLEGLIARPVRIEVIVLSGEVDPQVTLTTPSGNSLAVVNSTGPGEPEVIGQFQFPGDGFYELGITSLAGNGEVGVSIYTLEEAEIDESRVFSSTDQELRGTILHPASYHTYRLPLERGQRIDLTAQALVAGLDLLFELYAPDGQLLTARDDNLGSDPALWNFMPSQSGTYTVVLSNYDEGIGDYALRVAPSTGAGEAVIGTRTEIGVQGSPRRSNWTTFEGRALDAVRIEA